MSNREKVIKGLRQHVEGSMFDRCGECPYYEFGKDGFLCRDELLCDALALLKEQEVLEKQLDDSDRIKVVRCSECQYWQPPTYAEQEDGSTIGHCTAALNGQQTDAYWFCADGMR